MMAEEADGANLALRGCQQNKRQLAVAGTITIKTLTPTTVENACNIPKVRTA
jgi:hypothetical protein